MRMTFLGAAGTVTGSKYLLEHHGRHVLIDCDLIQGYKQLRLHNWDQFQLPVRDLDAIVLTHAHVDHSGYLPVLVRSGYGGPVMPRRPRVNWSKSCCSTVAVCRKKRPRFANLHGFSKHAPALPLYTEQDAERALKLLRPVELHHRVGIIPGLEHSVARCPGISGCRHR